MRKAVATVFGRLSGIRQLLLLSALIFLAVAVLANSVMIVERQEALGRVSRYNLTWLMSQAAHEVLRLEEVVSAAALPGSRVDADAVGLRVDVLANRMVLLRTGEAAEFLSERPELQRSVEELEATLPVIEKLAPQLPDPQVALHLRAVIEPLVPRMLQMAAAANVRSGDVGIILLQSRQPIGADLSNRRRLVDEQRWIHDRPVSLGEQIGELRDPVHPGTEDSAPSGGGPPTTGDADRFDTP